MIRFSSYLKAHLSKDKELYLAIKNIFGFYPKNIFLYKLAFLHRSAAVEVSKDVKMSNERLEYLGDAILGAIVADYLYKKFPIKDEGFLTEMRSKIVARQPLNKLSLKLGIDKLMVFESDHYHKSKSMLGDAFEAFVGALYLDLGYKKTKQILINRVIQIHYDIDKLVDFQLNYKSKLLEKCQKNKWTLRFENIGESGNNHMRQFTIEIFINDEKLASGCDFTIKGAEKIASEKAIIILQEREAN